MPPKLYFAMSGRCSPSRKYICDNCVRAAVDDDLWTLLENRVMRPRLRDYIVTHKLGNDRNKSLDSNIFLSSRPHPITPFPSPSRETLIR